MERSQDSHNGTLLKAGERHAVEGCLAGGLVGGRDTAHPLQAAQLQLARQVLYRLIHLGAGFKAALINKPWDTWIHGYMDTVTDPPVTTTRESRADCVTLLFLL